jgi:hypothetical protein
LETLDRELDQLLVAGRGAELAQLLSSPRTVRTSTMRAVQRRETTRGDRLLGLRMTLTNRVLSRASRSPVEDRVVVIEREGSWPSGLP